jgi:hypothetical protein
MEGACGLIVEENEKVVRKVLKRKYKGKTAFEQYTLQKLAIKVVEEYKLKIIYVPNVYSYDHRSYTMDRVDTSIPLYEIEVKSDIIEELKKFCSGMESKGFFANDIECYIQPNGQIAVLDFDKCEKVVAGQKRKANPFLPF